MQLFPSYSTKLKVSLKQKKKKRKFNIVNISQWCNPLTYSFFSFLLFSLFQTINFAHKKTVMYRWHGLTPKINTVVAALQKDQKIYREFISAHGAAIIGLTQVDVTLTQVQHLSGLDKLQASPRRRLQQLSDVETELTNQNATLRRADELALQLMRESQPDDVARVQELVDEYQLLWRDINNRANTLRENLESQERQEVDEAVQVETLKFEKDTAVQVDTLPKITKMTSFDAYLIELESAISECRVALGALESAIIPEPTPGTGLSTAARNIVSRQR